MGEEPLGALLKGKDSYQRVERGMLTFQVTHSRSRSDHSVKWKKMMLGRKSSVGDTESVSGILVWECIILNTQTDGAQATWFHTKLLGRGQCI